LLLLILILGTVAADSARKPFKGTVKTSISQQVDPGQSLTVYGATTDGQMFDFVRCLVLANYYIQPQWKDYTKGEPGVGVWVNSGEPIKNNEEHYENIYIYGVLASNSEQEWDGIYFHDYYITEEGMGWFNIIQAQFLQSLKRAASEPPSATPPADGTPTQPPAQPPVQPGDVFASISTTPEVIVGEETPFVVGGDIGFQGRVFGESEWQAGWDWDFGDGSAHAATQEATHKYANTGTHHVKLTATLQSGKSYTAEFDLTVKAKTTQPINKECENCSTIQQCLACLDKKMVDGLFPKEAK
ncbi:MAG: PKD domain-containing protein, partial [Candidatus Diapherotrites archaeon]|nr:PKD domain-containing protein [Candidatus Diapherotrites archaeon]